jgi:hypothetical protein
MAWPPWSDFGFLARPLAKVQITCGDLGFSVKSTGVTLPIILTALPLEERASGWNGRPIAESGDGHSAAGAG